MPGSGELLRALRLRTAKTLADVAREAGITAGTLSWWERSEMWPDAPHLHALCFALNASEEEVAALTCSEGIYACLPPTGDLEQISSLGWALYNQYHKPLANLMFFALEVQLWRLLPQQPEAQNILFALYYWQMKAGVNIERWEGEYADIESMFRKRDYAEVLAQAAMKTRLQNWKRRHRSTPSTQIAGCVITSLERNAI